MQVATRWIIAKLRNRQFFSLAELNAAIRELVTQLNDRVSRHLGASRRALFEELERAALKPLPAEPYVYAEWKQCRVGLDYHVEVEKHYYSVPHELLREKLWARITARTVEVFHRGKRVAVARALVIEPQAHDGARAHAVEPPALCRLDAGAHPAAGRRDRAARPRRWSRSSCARRTHPEQGFRACDRHPAARQELWPRAARSRLRPGARDRRALLHLGQVDPEEQPRSPTACHRHGRAGDRARQHPWPPLLPLRRRHAMLTHPTLDQLRALKLDGMAEAFVELQAQDAARDLAPRRMAGAAARPRGGQSQHQALPDPAARRPAAPRPGRRSRTSTTARRAGSTRRCSSSWPPAAGSPSTAICWSPGRAASASRG